MILIAALLLVAEPRAGSPVAASGQRYAMGTMFDVLVYHASAEEAHRAIDRAMAEITRLDRVLSHFDPDSDLSALVRSGRDRATRVDRSLYEVIQTSLELSRQSRGTFDITIGPLVRAYRHAREQARQPSAAEITAAQACMGYEKIEIVPPDRVRLHGDCLELDLGGIGKGYAVDRALRMLEDAGIRHAIVNAGGSSVGAIGAPPGRAGWPVVIGDSEHGRTILLRDGSLSTSQPAADSAGSGEMLDPHAGGPPSSQLTVSVFAKSATLSDGLATTLVLLPMAGGRAVLAQFLDVSAVWLSPRGSVEASYGEAMGESVGARWQP